MIVHAVEHLAAILLQVVKPPRKRAMDARLGEGLGDVDEHRDVAAVGVVGLVVLGRKALPLLPTGNDRLFPRHREQLLDDVNRLHLVPPCTGICVSCPLVELSHRRHGHYGRRRRGNQGRRQLWASPDPAPQRVGFGGGRRGGGRYCLSRKSHHAIVQQLHRRLSA